MKKWILGGALFFVIALLSGLSWASMGGPTNTAAGQVAARTRDNRFTLGNAVGPTPSHTPATDTSNKIDSRGYGTTQFRFVETTFWGALSVQGSMDDSTYVDLFKTTTSAATTQTIYWQCSEPWSYYKVVTLPSINNTGTVATSGTQLVNSTGKTGFYGPHKRPLALLANASRSAATINALEPYFHTDGVGVKVMLKQVSDSSGSLAWILYSVGPDGVMTKQGVGYTAISTAGTYSITVQPNVAGAGIQPVQTPTNDDLYNQVIVGTGNSWYLDLTESGTSTEFSVDVLPIY